MTMRQRLQLFLEELEEKAALNRDDAAKDGDLYTSAFADAQKWAAAHVRRILKGQRMGCEKGGACKT